MLFRRRHELRQHLGTEFPDLVLSLVIDAMDNAKTTLPRLEGLLHSKRLDNKGQTLACELLAVLVHGYMFYGSLILPHLKTNAATSITVLHQVFTQVTYSWTAPAGWDCQSVRVTDISARCRRSSIQRGPFLPFSSSRLITLGKTTKISSCWRTWAGW